MNKQDMDNGSIVKINILGSTVGIYAARELLGPKITWRNIFEVEAAYPFHFNYFLKFINQLFLVKPAP